MEKSIVSLVKYGSSVVVRTQDLETNELVEVVKHARSMGGTVTIVNAASMSQVDRESIAEVGGNAVTFDFVNLSA